MGFDIFSYWVTSLTGARGDDAQNASIQTAVDTVVLLDTASDYANPVKGVVKVGLKKAVKSLVTKKADDTIYRMGTSKESKTRLGKKAQEAEDFTGNHGVSGSSTKPNVACSSASCSSLESAGFKVTRSPTRRDPNHVTIGLPKPVTKKVADKFNKAFKR